MLKKAETRLLTRAARIRKCVFAGIYRAATVRESVPVAFFSILPEVKHLVGFLQRTPPRTYSLIAKPLPEQVTQTAFPSNATPYG
jgi:hypothetical protein